ncbi:hypothetical protein HYV74_01625 [Candidatus Uhrbacteria bacterium]|nr:hypothetical protein [Candidatus Uhrbacteria bacterium]
MRAATKTTAVTEPGLPVDPIPRALALLGVQPEQLARRIAPAEARAQLQRIQEFQRHDAARLLPIERAATARAVKLRVAALESRLPAFQRIPFPALAEVLQWRNEQGMPALAPFSPQSDRFTIRVEPDSWNNGPRTIEPHLPAPVLACYEDVFLKLEERRGRRNVRVEAAVTFTGTIPSDVREAIRAAQQTFSDVRILAEVERWQIEEHAPPALRTDPLVIGYDGVEFWLIAAFDLTPLEETVHRICLGTAPSVA